jgi:hypothetical protein
MDDSTNRLLRSTSGDWPEHPSWPARRAHPGKTRIPDGRTADCRHADERRPPAPAVPARRRTPSVSTRKPMPVSSSATPMTMLSSTPRTSPSRSQRGLRNPDAARRIVHRRTVGALSRGLGVVGSLAVRGREARHLRVRRAGRRLQRVDAQVLGEALGLGPVVHCFHGPSSRPEGRRCAASAAPTPSPCRSARSTHRTRRTPPWRVAREVDDVELGGLPATHPHA